MKRPYWAYLAALVAGVIGSGGASQSSAAVVLVPGDLLVTDPESSVTTGQIVEIDPITGAQAVVVAGGQLDQPTGICFDAAGQIIVSNYGGSPGNHGSIVRVNPLTGTQTVVSTGGLLNHPVSVVTNAAGQLVVTQQGANQVTGAVLQIDPNTGAQRAVASGGSLKVPAGITVGTTGTYFVSQFQPSEIIGVNPTTGAQQVVASGGYLDFGPEGLTGDVTQPGNLLVAEAGSTPELLRINEATGAQSVISSGGLLALPVDVAQDAAGDTFLSNGTNVLQVDLDTGTQRLIASGGSLVTPRGLVVVPEPAGMAVTALGLAALVRRRRPRRTGC